MRQIDYIIIHSKAGKKPLHPTFHYSIASNGIVHQGKYLKQEGCHSGDYNKSSIKINLAPGYPDEILCKLLLKILDHHPMAKMLAIEEFGDHRVVPTAEMNNLRRELSWFERSEDYP